MAKTPLNIGHRNALSEFAKKHVTDEKTKAVMDKAYAKTISALLPMIKKSFPPDDMEVLRKYEVTRRDSCIQGGDPEGRVIRFEFREEDAPLLPDKYCSSRQFQFTAACRDLINAYGVAKLAHEKALEEKLSDYRRLIMGSRYFEDLTAIWPAAETLRPSIVRQPTALAVLSEETIARIRRDNAGSDTNPLAA